MRNYTGIFFTSFATLLLELTLTRAFSVSWYYHFGFLIISTALLGFGAAGSYLALQKEPEENKNLPPFRAKLSLAFAISVMLGYAIFQAFPFNPFAVLESKTQFIKLLLFYFFAILPFFFSGLIIASLLKESPTQIPKLYMYDLVGGGLSCMLFPFVISFFELGGTISIVSVFGLLSAISFSYKSKNVLPYAILTVFLVIFSFFANNIFPIAVSVEKLEELVDKKPIYSASNAISLIEVYEMAGKERGPNYVDSLRCITFDKGTAATEMLDLRPDVTIFVKNLQDTAKLADTVRLLSACAYTNKINPKVLIIGSGGGEEVFHGLYFGASKMVAVEINPLINDLVMNKMDDYVGHLFQQKQVELYTEDARSYIRRSPEKFDIIVAIHTISNAAMASGAMSLAENYVLTQEAFEEYWNHLTENGVLFFTRPPAQVPRLVCTLRKVMEQQGISNFSQHFIISPKGILCKKSPFTSPEIAEAEKRMGYNPEDSLSFKKIKYSPLHADTSNIFYAILHTPSLDELYLSKPESLVPATDDMPFFNHRFKWLKLEISQVKALFQLKTDVWTELEIRPVAEILLLILFVQSFFLAGIFILLPAFWRRKKGEKRAFYGLYFAGIGLGFILLEMVFLQKYTLFIGQPIYTYAIVLASLLIFTGIGSYFLPKITEKYPQFPRYHIPILVIFILLYSLFLPYFFEYTLEYSLISRLLLSVFSLFPIGILLGMAFPIGMSKLSSPQSIAFAWAINSFFTVIGTILALMIGMAWGFNVVIMSAIIAYSLAWIGKTL